MKITITGSLGNISKPLATTLVQKKHAVTVITSSNERQSEIENLGASASRNRGLGESSAEYVLFLDDDDWITPTHVAVLIQALKDNPTIILTHRS